MRVRPSGEAGPPNLESKTRHNNLKRIELIFNAEGAETAYWLLRTWQQRKEINKVNNENKSTPFCV